MSDTFGPYTPVRHAGNLYFVSGQVGLDAAQHAASDVATQTRQVLENLKNVLATVNLDLDDVVKTTVYLVNMEDFTAMNEVYETFFAVPRPARSTVAVKSLPRLAGVPLLVEIEAVAAKGGTA